MSANWLDKTISWVAPQAGLRRIRARTMAQAMLAYEAARSDRRQGGWITTANSGNADIGASIAKIRQNARDLYQNNSFVKKIVRRRSRRAVGYGITPQADTGNAQLNAAIDDRVSKWARVCCSDQRMNFWSLQQMIVEAEMVSGECLIRMWDRRPEDGLPIPLQLQVLEPDYLDTSKTEQINTGYIIHGVQFDLLGRVVGYWMFGQHPGEVVTSTRRGYESAFVSADNVLHHLEFERPGNVRAVSRLAPIIAKLRDIDELADAAVLRAKVHACLAAVVKQPEGIDGPTLGVAKDGSTVGMVDADGNRQDSLQPRMIAYTPPGSEISFLSPSGESDYATIKKMELREIATGVDIPYVVVGDDLSDVNYSSFRGGALDERDAIEQYRQNWLIPQVLDPIWRRLIDRMVLLGVMNTPEYGVKWNPPPFDVLDREAEARADQLELQTGKMTWAQLVGGQGYDPEKQIAEIEKWQPRLVEAGVKFSDKNGGANASNQQTPAAQ